MSYGRVLPYQGVMEHGCTIGSTRTESAFYGTRAEAFLLKQPIRHSWRWCNPSSKRFLHQGVLCYTSYV